MARPPRTADPLATVTHERRSVAGQKKAQARLGVVMPRELAAWTTVGEKPLVLGRGTALGNWTLAHATVSREHADIVWRDGRHVIVDRGSRNGTFHNGQPVRPDDPHALVDGDIVTVGDVVLVYETGVAPAEAPAVSIEAVPGVSRASRQLRARVQQAAHDPSPVLLLGQTGTGKEFLAREIHRLSWRAGALVATNVAELSKDLVESQLFGHEKGAFTGADRAQEGLFRAAHRGTLFLDEIGELPLGLQPKLLRALQEGEVRPVGATKSVPVDVRIVAATNRDLEADIAADRFRRDLYARLALWEIRVPSLAERKADIIGWLDRFYAHWRARRGLPPGAPFAVSVRGVEALLSHAWPDNLRGLDRVVHRLAAEVAEVGEDGVVSASLLAEVLPPRPEPDSETPGELPKDKPAPPTTREELQAVMDQHGGSVRAMARYYDRERRQIYRWLERFGLRGSDD